MPPLWRCHCAIRAAGSQVCKEPCELLGLWCPGRASTSACSSDGSTQPWVLVKLRHAVTRSLWICQSSGASLCGHSLFPEPKQETPASPTPCRPAVSVTALSSWCLETILKLEFFSALVLVIQSVCGYFAPERKHSQAAPQDHSTAVSHLLPDLLLQPQC